MITKIEKVKNLRIFKDFKWKDQNEFGKYNLFYGLNGSGKTTLSNLIDLLRTKDISNYPGCLFSIKLNDGREINNLNLVNTNENIYVFNKTFIDDNLAEFSNVKGVVYLSNENINLKKTLEEKYIEKERRDKELQLANCEYDFCKKSFDSLLSAAAKEIKEEFHKIGGFCSRYSNYNRTHFLEDIDRYKQSFNNLNLEEQEIDKKIIKFEEILKDDIKQNIDSLKPLNNKFKTSLKNVEKILTKKVEKHIVINNLSEKIFDWLNEGFLLHKDDTCLYCGNLISKERQIMLKNVFDHSLEDFKKNINEELDFLENFECDYSYINENVFYKDYRDILSPTFANLNSNIKRLKEDIKKIIKLLRKKLKNFSTDIEVDVNFKDVLNVFDIINGYINEINRMIDSNNEQNESYELKQEDAVKQLKKFLVYKKCTNFQIIEKQNDVIRFTKKCKDLEMHLIEIDKIIKDLESEIIDVVSAGNDFNILLAQFLGRKEIELQFDEITKGYKVIRKENNSLAENLSEGEKTAIAFIYFLIKIKEKNNKIEDSIVLFDDPISSMDSNHVFNAYSFIVSYFENAKQLFVLTHNFAFFKLMRRYLGQEKQASKNMYFIESKYINNVRTAQISNLPKSLLQATSEYPYLISKLLDYVNNGETIGDNEFVDILNIANISRKVIESFCSFKVPHKSHLRDALKELFKLKCNDSGELSQDEKSRCERIYKFINFYSHDCTFINDEDLNSLLGEACDVVNDILILIESCDSVHFNSIKQQIKYL